MKVENFNGVKNQFIIHDYKIGCEKGIMFQSYNSLIAFIPYDMSLQVSGFPHQRIRLDREKWDYSKTTGKYRNIFLSETKKETEKKIKSGKYILTNLNEREK